MTRCPELDQLVAVGAAVDWDVELLLEHLRYCGSCREELGRLATVHGALAAEVAPRVGLVDAVMTDIVEQDTRRASLRRAVPLALTPVLAAITAFFAMVLVGAGASPGFSPPGIAGAAALVALGTAWWNRKAAREPASVAG